MVQRGNRVFKVNSFKRTFVLFKYIVILDLPSNFIFLSPKGMSTCNDNLIDLSLFESHPTPNAPVIPNYRADEQFCVFAFIQFLTQNILPPYFLPRGPDCSSQLKHHLLFPSQHPQSKHPLSSGATSLLVFVTSPCLNAHLLFQD